MSPGRHCQDELPEETRRRRLRAWRMRGQPQKPRRQDPPGPREAAVLAAHDAGVLVLGGDYAAGTAAA